MRLVHLADLHLGFRQFHRTDPSGVNQRETDLASTFERVVDQIIALEPQLVVVAGDVFHMPRPSNRTILTAFREFGRLALALPRVPIVVVAGNHDTPRSSDGGGILQLFAPLGIHVVDGAARRLSFPELDLGVLAVPDAGFSRPPLEPDPARRFNVMVLHGEVQGMLPRHTGRALVEIPSAELHAPRWDYVALGHYHVHRKIACNAFYSGSIDYTSSNPWGELAEERAAGLDGKGFIERDLATGTQTFHAVAPSRWLIDVHPIDAAAMSAAELDAAIASRVDELATGLDGTIVRVLVRNARRNAARHLDHKAIRRYRRRALHFHLDIRFQEATRGPSRTLPLPAPSLEATVKEFLAQRFVASPDVDPRTLMERAAQYVSEVGQQTPATDVAEVRVA